MSKIYYKVLSIEDHRLYSYATNEAFLPKKFRVLYEKNQWNYPTVPNSYLFVFDSLESAKKFNRYNVCTIIYSCKIKGKRKAPPKIFSEPFYYDINIKKFWENVQGFKSKKKSVKLDRGKDTPEGTVCCEALWLLDQVNV